jgi:hypothetical protein
MMDGWAADIPEQQEETEELKIEDENPSFLALESENPDKRKFKASFIGHLSDLENKR